MIQAAIVGIGRIPKKANSHGYGWARTWSENLNVPIDHKFEQPYDVAYVEHGVNFGGSLNLFGGFTEDLKVRCDNLMNSNFLYSLDREMPDYGAMLAKRKDVTDKDWCERLSNKLKKAKIKKSTHLNKEWLTIGDSHTAAYSRPDSAVIKTDGLTLNGQVNEDFEYVRSHIDEMGSRVHGVTMSFGNIDIRHHICRLDADYKSLIRKWKEFGDSLDMEVEYNAPWPIEFEGRKLPKTGYYKDKPFWGSRNERSEIVSEWISEMKCLNMNIVMPPADWYNMNPEKYAKEYMESTSSVHLSPTKYRRRNWDMNSLEQMLAT